MKRRGAAFPDCWRISSFLFLHSTNPSNLVGFLNPVPRFEGFPTAKSLCASILYYTSSSTKKYIFSRSLYPFLHCCPPLPQIFSLGSSSGDPKDSLYYQSKIFVPHTNLSISYQLQYPRWREKMSTLRHAFTPYLAM